jgi:ceramide glucosyltransferase
VLSTHVIDHLVLNSDFVDSQKHQVRWMKSTRFSRPIGHFGPALTFSMPFGLLGLIAGVAAHHPAVGIGLLAWAVASRLALSIAVGNWVVGDRDWFNLLVLYPIRDLLGFCFWAASYFSSTILWRGRVFQLLPGGKMRAAK